MEWINNGVLRYQHQIGTYDKQLWERSVEKTVLKNIQNVPRKTVKNKPELIDVDLVRGSTFPKAKPTHGILAVTRLGLTRVLFMPLYCRWWHQQTNTYFTLVLLLLYILQGATIGIYWTDSEQKLSAESLSLAHVVTPLLMMVILGLMHAHIVATHELYRPRRKATLDAATIRPPMKLKKPKQKKSTSTPSCQSERDSASHDTGIETHPEDVAGLRQRKFSTKTLLNRRRSGSVFNSNNLVIPKTDPDRSDEADDELEDIEIKRPCPEVKVTKLKLELAEGELCTNLDTLPGDFSLIHPNFKKQDSSEFETLGIEPELHTTAWTAASSVGSKVAGRGLDPADSSEQDCAGCTCEDTESLRNGFAQVTGLIIGIETSKSVDPKTVARDMPSTVQSDNQKFEVMKTESDSSLDKSLLLESGDLDKLRASGKVQKCGVLVSSIDDDALVNGKTTEEFVSEHLLKVRGSVPSENTKDGSQFAKKNTKTSCPKKPGSFSSRRKRQFKRVSSRETEGENPNQPNSSQLLHSETEWGDIGHTDMTSCGNTTSSNTASDSDLTEGDDLDSKDAGTTGVPHVASVIKNLASTSDKVSCLIWEGEEVKKIDLTVLDIGWSIIRKVDKIPETCDYLILGLVFSLVHSALPIFFRLYHAKGKLETVDPLTITQEQIHQAQQLIFGDHWSQAAVVCNGMVQRCFLGFVLFFLLSVAERTFKQRLLYAKHFCYLTSSRRARKYEMPHFRLNKVRNIKTWFSLRSYLKKRGPQRSVDTIVSVAFIVEVILISIMCFQLLQDSENFLDHLGNWELVVWCMALAIYLLRFMTLGTKINKKYRNFSVLITEQINLYLQMEQKPHKKDELMMANSVLKLAEALLKELEIPFKISGLSANPFLYNITKVILLSAFSAVLTELLGFKLKLYKIKLRA